MSRSLQKLVIKALEDVKGKEIVSLDVSEISDVMDTLIVVSGTSNRQVKSLANNVVIECKKAGIQPLGVEGGDVGEWVLVDLGNIVVHCMLPTTRLFYDLEKLWSMRPSDLVDE